MENAEKGVFAGESEDYARADSRHRVTVAYGEVMADPVEVGRIRLDRGVTCEEFGPLPGNAGIPHGQRAPDRRRQKKCRQQLPFTTREK
ncbi:hypothetical protein [Nonomuraea sp. NPDC003214]